MGAFIGSVYLPDGTLLSDDVEGDIYLDHGPAAGSYRGEFKADDRHNNTLMPGERFVLKTDAGLKIQILVSEVLISSRSNEIAVQFASHGRPLEGG